MKKRYQFLAAAFAFTAIYIAANIISIWSFSFKDQKCESDAAIILGASTANGEVSPVYQERINHGIQLYREGYVSKLIVTGGIGEGNSQSDADAARQYAMKHGIPETDIILETTSTTTQENLENSKLIMDQYQYSTAIIVSDPLHMRRAMRLAEDAGIHAYSSPTPTSKYSSFKTQIPFLAREVFFYIGYKLWKLIPNI